jgi:RNA polymerase sigma-70 factor (ECF subfamily)
MAYFHDPASRFEKQAFAVYRSTHLSGTSRSAAMSTKTLFSRPLDMMGVMAERLAARAEPRVGTGEFGSWMVSEQKRVFLLCLRMLQDQEEADSATQDTFLKAFLALQKSGASELEEPGKWVTRIAVNTCLDRLRSRKWQFWRRRPAPEEESSILDATPALEPGADARVFAQQINRRLARALDKLSSRQRAVFTLRHYEGCSLEEIAGILDLGIGTVKMHLFRTMKKLRLELHDLYFGRRS